MLCEQCKERAVTTDVVLEGVHHYLCDECRREQGIYTASELFFNQFFFRESPPKETQKEEARCPCCGITFAEIQKQGEVGCAACYHTFLDKLMPLVKRMQGHEHHVGKVSPSAGVHEKIPSLLEKYQKELVEAVAAERYEEAAAVRDQIKSLQEGGETGGKVDS